jgi:hypothetical protein
MAKVWAMPGSARHEVHLPHDGIGALEGGGIRELHEHDVVAHVLRGDVATGDFANETFCREEDEAAVTTSTSKREADEFAHEPA